MIKVKFVSNNDEIRRHTPFSPIEMNILPEMGHMVKLNNRTYGKVLHITHDISDNSTCDVEIYLTVIN